MPTTRYDYTRVAVEEEKYGKGKTLNTLPIKTYESFGPAVLGLGDIAAEGEHISALACVFDLEGFTTFCNQVDSHLVVPRFLSTYLDWLFGRIRHFFKEGEVDGRARIWGSLPFFAKFMGDGVLLLWDTKMSGRMAGYRNIVANLWYRGGVSRGLLANDP